VSQARHLVVFVKAPRLGAVKTRLAADIGALAAWRFYRAMTARLLRRLGRDRRWRLWLAVTPDRFAHGPAFWPPTLPRLAQGGGDLGRRMARVLNALPPGPAIIVGSDVPGIGVDHVARAFAALSAHDLVFGPAADGGYWLVGARRRPLPRGMFANVRWSSAHALADTLAGLDRRRSVALIDRLADVDRGADLAIARSGAAGAR